jgi:hypothetical protein
MNRVLLGAAVAAIATFTSTSPADAQGAAAGGSFSSIAAHRPLPGLRMARHAGGRNGDFRHRPGGFRHIHVGDGFVGPGWGYEGYGYDYDDLNASWRPDSFNDWWHDRPDRAFPRWMARNRDCARRWYSADALSC